MRPTSKVRALAATAIASIVIAAGGSAAFADPIVNSIDASVDATAEVMTLSSGGPNGSTTLYVVPAGGDGKPGCNLTSNTTLTVSVGSSNAAAAVVTPASVTFTSCGDVKPLTVTPGGAGTALITLTQTANTTGATFDLSTATFSVVVTAPLLKPTTTTLTCPTTTPYIGLPVAPCSAVVTGEGLNQSVPVVYSEPRLAPGQVTATATFAPTTTHAGSTSSKTFEIVRAQSSTSVDCPASATYTGAALTPCSATVSLANGATLSFTPEYSNNVAVGAARATDAYAGDVKHEPSDGADTFEIVRAAPVCSGIVGYTGQYDGVAHGASGTCVGVNGEALTGELSLGATFTNVPGGTADWTFTPTSGNYSAVSGSVPISIRTRDADCSSITGYTGGYDGNAHGAAGTCKGVNGEVLPGLTLGTTFTNAPGGTANWTFTPTSGNYTSSSGSVQIVIGKATAACSVPNVTKAFDGSVHAVTGVCTGVGGADLSDSLTIGAGQKDAGTYAVDWSFDGSPNYADRSGSATLTINPAASTTVVSCPASVSYTGSAQTSCTAKVTGPGGLVESLTVSYTANTDVGTATASASYGASANHLGSSDTATFSITKALTTTQVTCTTGPFAYTGLAQTPCTAEVTGPGGLNQTLTPDYTDNTGAGTAHASAAYAGTGNYQASSDTATFTIDKADSSITLDCTSPRTFTGSPIESCSAQADLVGPNDLPVLLEVSYTENTNAGTASAAASWDGDDNHNGTTASTTLTIIAAATVTKISCPTSVTYDGSAQEPCTATATGPTLNTSPTVTYTDNTIAGPAQASASYAGTKNLLPSSDTAIFTIDKAASDTVITCPASVSYTGSAQEPCTAGVTGPGGLVESLTVSYTGNTDVGTANASASYGASANHLGSSDTETFSITKALTTTKVTCTTGPFTYTGLAQTPCRANVTGPGGLNQTLTPTYADNTGAGTAKASAGYAGTGNYQASNDTDTFTIDKADSSISLMCTSPRTYTGFAIESCSAQANRVGPNDAPISLSVTYTDNTNAGTAGAAASWIGDDNHNGTDTSRTFTIVAATTVTTINCPANVTYTGSAQAPCTATVSGPALDEPLDVSYTNNTDAGPANAAASYPGSRNYASSSDTETFTIDKAASATLVTCPPSVSYTGSAQEPCTAEVTGPGGLKKSLDVAYGSNTNAGSATSSATYAGDTNHVGSSDSTTFQITPAVTVTTVTCPASVTYSGSAHTPCTAKVTGPGNLNESLTVVHTDNTNAGTATAAAAYAGTGNYQASFGSKTFTIAKAVSATVVTCTSGPFVYTGAAFTPCSAKVTGVGGLSQSLGVSYTNNTNPGTATASATYAEGANHLTSSDSKTFVISAWTLKGFYSPVDMNGVWNTVKSGSTVPLKWEVFAGTTELTNVSAIRSVTSGTIACGATGTEDAIEEIATTGGTTLRYDSAGGQFIDNWATPKNKAGTCYRVTMTTQDGSSLSALFKLK